MSGIKKGMTQSERLAVIAEAAERFNKKLKRNQRVRRTETSFMDKFNDGGNINAWTDAPKYLDEYYGDRVRETNAYDNDWN
ncbi:MAG: hypothetical protein ACPHL3_05975 [Paracoccaceae bacterium]